MNRARSSEGHWGLCCSELHHIAQNEAPSSDLFLIHMRLFDDQPFPITGLNSVSFQPRAPRFFSPQLSGHLITVQAPAHGIRTRPAEQPEDSDGDQAGDGFGVLLTDRGGGLRPRARSSDSLQWDSLGRGDSLGRDSVGRDSVGRGGRLSRNGSSDQSSSAALRGFSSTLGPLSRSGGDSFGAGGANGGGGGAEGEVQVVNFPLAISSSEAKRKCVEAAVACEAKSLCQHGACARNADFPGTELLWGTHHAHIITRRIHHR